MPRFLHPTFVDRADKSSWRIGRDMMRLLLINAMVLSIISFITQKEVRLWTNKASSHYTLIPWVVLAAYIVRKKDSISPPPSSEAMVALSLPCIPFNIR